MVFDEHSEKAQALMRTVEEFLAIIEVTFWIKYKNPPHDIARRFLNEIEEFKSAEE